MAERAKVTSLEAIESFRANLIVYLAKARPALEEVATEVARTANWLRNDQMKFWKHQMKLRRRKLEQAQQELFSARLSTFREVTSSQQMAVHRTERAVREADEKLIFLKKWSRDLENRSDPLVKEVNQLQNFLTSDMIQAVAYLDRVSKALEAYTKTPRPESVGATGGMPEPKLEATIPGADLPDAKEGGRG